MAEEKKDAREMSCGEVHPDAHGWQQQHPDARGYKPGTVEKEADDGKWQSRHPDAHGWHRSSSR